MTDLAHSFSFKLWFNLRAHSGLWAKFMVSKYCGGNHPTMCSWSIGNSSVWKRLCKVKWAAEPSIAWGLGVGNIFFWKDRWLNGISLDMILNTTSCSLLKDGSFRLKEAWNSFRKKKEALKIYKFFWHHSIPITVSVFLWRMVHKYIPSDDRLIKKGFFIPSKCQCCYHMDSLHHIFLSGPLAVKVWIHFEELFQLNFFKANLSIISLLSLWFLNSKGHIRNMVPSLIIWYLWMERNNSHFNGIVMNHQRVIYNVSHKIGALFNAKVISIKSFNNCFFAMEKLGIILPAENMMNMPRSIVWRKPNPNFFKLNVDIFTRNLGWGCGGLIRDSKGCFIMGFAGPLPNSGAKEVNLAITNAVLYGLRLCLSLDLVNLVVETNSKLWDHYMLWNDSTVNCTHKMFYMRREFNSIRAGLHVSFEEVMPQANACATAFAKWGFGLVSVMEVQMSILPRRLRGMVDLDIIGLPYYFVDWYHKILVMVGSSNSTNFWVTLISFRVFGADVDLDMRRRRAWFKLL
ncbi:hypothetical protein M5K25_022164 [Dendrobium thyrsiflorum]|uniref:Reverse transcriptase zinc-binding domain-containing protein n=1 Tax=Dendrobium thyrsiflorum TaxID=117978 RepID=A0ABD0UBK2_DENTH